MIKFERLCVEMLGDYGLLNLSKSLSLMERTGLKMIVSAQSLYS